jgi:hypothetical protein
MKEGISLSFRIRMLLGDAAGEHSLRQRACGLPGPLVGIGVEGNVSGVSASVGFKQSLLGEIGAVITPKDGH